MLLETVCQMVTWLFHQEVWQSTHDTYMNILTSSSESLVFNWSFHHSYPTDNTETSIPGYVDLRSILSCCIRFMNDTWQYMSHAIDWPAHTFNQKEDKRDNIMIKPQKIWQKAIISQLQIE